MEYVSSFNGWKIYQLKDGWYCARKGRRWLTDYELRIDIINAITRIERD